MGLRLKGLHSSEDREEGRSWAQTHPTAFLLHISKCLQAILGKPRFKSVVHSDPPLGDIRPGRAEEQALALTRTMLKDAGILRGWHGIHVRFGTNTLKNFGEPSEPGVVLDENDIFFIDIGPVWQGHEGDGGETFTVGDEQDMRRAAQDVRAVFDATHDHWRHKDATGMALYHFAAAEADRRGWVLNLKMSGHRLSDFPHAVHHKGSLLAVDYTPSTAAWVLEIQIRHPVRPFSAFYEDLLLG